MISFAEIAATPVPPADHRETYGPDPLQFGELRLPAGTTGRVPVVVFLHGGCWRAAYDLRHVAAAASALASAGYAVWVPEYRRVGDSGGGWPGTFDDVAAAVDHVRDLAGRYPTLDTARVVLAGHSAGGQLALWAASRRAGDAAIGAARSEGGSATGAAPTRAPLRVAGVVSLAGITDMAAYGAGTGSCNSAVTPLLGGTATDVADRYRAVSPVERLPIGVPVTIVHGAADPIVPVAQSRDFEARAKRAGESITVVEVPGAGHFDLVAPQSTAWAAVMDAIRALTMPVRRPGRA
jgi:acetyl esterase/lipase